MIYLVVFIGGGLGSVCRFLIGKLLSGAAVTFPLGTLAVNLLGCILVGMLYRYGGLHPGSLARAALIVGFCGGFTTFSAFSLETATMVTSGRWGLAAAYVATSVIGCLAGTLLVVRGVLE